MLFIFLNFLFNHYRHHCHHRGVSLADQLSDLDLDIDDHYQGLNFYNDIKHGHNSNEHDDDDNDEKKGHRKKK